MTPRTHSEQHTVPKGARVVAVMDPEGEEIALEDERGLVSSVAP